MLVVMSWCGWTLERVEGGCKANKNALLGGGSLAERKKDQKEDSKTFFKV